MIGWSTIAPFLIDLFAELAQDPTKVVEPVDGTGGTRKFNAEWKEGQRPAIHDIQRFSLMLKLTNVASVGRDENRREFFPEVPNVSEARLEEKVVGMRKFTLQVQAHSSERTDDVMAMVPLDRVRVGLRRRSTIDRLLEQEISIIRINDAVKANYPDAGRIVSAASMDVVFYAAFDSIDPIPGSWIETVFYTSHFEDVDGVELPVPPNVVNHQIPPP